MPESWNLASQMSIVIQLANIGPLVVTLMDLKCNRYLKLEPLVSGTKRVENILVLPWTARGKIKYLDICPVGDWSHFTTTVMLLLGSPSQRKINSIFYFIFCYFGCRLYLIRNGWTAEPQTKLTTYPHWPVWIGFGKFHPIKSFFYSIYVAASNSFPSKLFSW